MGHNGYSSRACTRPREKVIITYYFLEQLREAGSNAGIYGVHEIPHPKPKQEENASIEAGLG